MHIIFKDYLETLTTSGAQHVAFFDLDRTLIDGYSLTALAWQQLFNNQMSLQRFTKLGIMFSRYGLGQIDYAQMLSATVEDIRGIQETELYDLGRQAYEDRLIRWMYVEGEALVAKHRALGHDLVIVTSATRYQALPLAERLGITTLCCTQLCVEQGRIEGVVQACYGPAKLEAAEQYLDAQGKTMADSYFYSDSCDDLPLMCRVGNPVVVNGKRSLVAEGEQRGWPILRFFKKGLPLAASTEESA